VEILTKVRVIVVHGYVCVLAGSPVSDDAEQALQFCSRCNVPGLCGDWHQPEMQSTWSANVAEIVKVSQAFIRTVDQRGLQVSTQVKRRLALRGWRQRGTCATWQPWVVHHAGASQRSGSHVSASCGEEEYCRDRER